MTLPISLTGARAIFSIATLPRGRAPLAVCLSVFLLGFAALEIRAQEEPTRLDELVVSDGRVQFFFFSAGRCIQISNTTINGVTYTIHSSYWQRRSGAGAPWEEIPGTQETGRVCSLSPESEGEYRLVADITIGDERGFYKSNTLFDPEPGQVTGVRVVEGVEQLTVSWNEITDSGPGWNGAEGYVVEWKSGSENYSSRRRHRVDGGSITSYTITGLTAGTAYTVRVSAKLASTTGGFPHDGKPSDEVTATPRATGTDPGAVEPKPPGEVQATVEAAVEAGGGLRAGGPPVTIDMSTLFSFGAGGIADTDYAAQSSDPAVVAAETTDERLVLTPGNPLPAGASSSLAVGTADGDPARATITVTAVRAGEMAEVEFTVEVEAAAEPVPALPLLGQLLLALGLAGAGARRLVRSARRP